MKLYIAVLDRFPDHMVPTLVAHSMLSAHLKFSGNSEYDEWLTKSFKKCVVRVNNREFSKISQLDHVHVGHENKTLGGEPSCVVVMPSSGEVPNVLKFAKLWKPRDHISAVDSQALIDAATSMTKSSSGNMDDFAHTLIKLVVYHIQHNH